MWLAAGACGESSGSLWKRPVRRERSARRPCRMQTCHGSYLLLAALGFAAAIAAATYISAWLVTMYLTINHKQAGHSTNTA